MRISRIYLLENHVLFNSAIFGSIYGQNPTIMWRIRVIQWRLRRIRPYSSRFGSTFGSLFGCNRDYGPFWSHMPRFWPRFGLPFDLIRMPKIDSVQFLAILFDCELNQRLINYESAESFRFRPYSGRIGANLFGRIRFWCNLCIKDHLKRRPVGCLILWIHNWVKSGSV